MASLYNTIIDTLRQESDLSEKKIQELAGEIAKLIESQAGLTSLPDTFVQHELGELTPIIQVLLAHDRSSVQTLTGDYEGAIADFRVYLEWQTDYHAVAQRQLREYWTEELKAGRNPFNQTTLLSLS